MAVDSLTSTPANHLYNVRFPQKHETNVQQDDEWCELLTKDHVQHIRFHDYAFIFNNRGLYEQLFVDRLKCSSHRVVTDLLGKETHRLQGAPLHAMDLGAGNGLVGAQLHQLGASRLIGCDILPEAKQAALRDQPGIYDDYLICDLTNLSDEHSTLLHKADINVLTIVGALGFGDIPKEAFLAAIGFVKNGGLIAFNLKDQFYGSEDQSGFSETIKESVVNGRLAILSEQKYCHRLSVTGQELYYYAFVAVKRS
ncbi:hypothetical protein PFICI_08258 [Pestalotiopsis fici W106-1]|uniref:Methyltransferase domain-containing protein n=1 Tax=Pestalotiopsis fici (strain W106-1 / CGMCC3.15140) TaxID=1229662 RepID=W3X414_PESFW|nr:uncharacterized protein PFICI_08258 [Pestalotiopsis fici W106-1]ETS80729.1 hypothetical protein PFICI_08258 [Pestalotiopsis fici W106-1]